MRMCLGLRENASLYLEFVEMCRGNFVAVSFGSGITLQLAPTHMALGQPFLVVQAPSHGITFIIKEEKYFGIRLLDAANKLCIWLKQAHAEA